MFLFSVGSTKPVTSRLQNGMSRPRAFRQPIHSTALCSAMPFSFHHFNGRNAILPDLPHYYSTSNCNYHMTATTTISRTRPLTTKRRIPRKAALALTPKARNIFKKLITTTASQGIMLKFEISSQHALRMAFKFDLIKDASKELSELDEG